jgi:hypothetical protein
VVAFKRVVLLVWGEQSMSNREEFALKAAGMHLLAEYATQPGPTWRITHYL